MLTCLAVYLTGVIFTLWSKWHFDEHLPWVAWLNAACWPIGLPLSIVWESKRRAAKKR